MLLLPPAITRCFECSWLSFSPPALYPGYVILWPFHGCGGPLAHSMVQMPKAWVSSLLARATPHSRTRPALLASPPTLFHLHVSSCCSHPVDLKCSPGILKYSIPAVRNQGSESLIDPWSKGDRLGSPQKSPNVGKDEREEASLAWKQRWLTAGPSQAQFMSQLGYFVSGVLEKGKRACFEVTLLPFLSWTQIIYQCPSSLHLRFMKEVPPTSLSSMGPGNSTPTETGGRAATCAHTIRLQPTEWRPVSWGACGCSQTVPFLLTFAASRSPLQDWHAAETNKRQALCQQIFPASSRKALEVARAHGRQLCQLLFVVQPVPAGALLLLRLLSFWALEFRLPCLHKQNTSPPRSTLPGLCGSSFQATHRDLWGTTGGYSLPWCLDTGPAQWGGYTGAKILQGWVALTHVGRALFLHPWLPNWCLYLLLVHKHIQRWAESHRLLLLNIMHGGSDGQNPVPGEKGNCSPSLKINVPSQRHILEHVWLRCQGIPQCSWDSLDF